MTLTYPSSQQQLLGRACLSVLQHAVTVADGRIVFFRAGVYYIPQGSARILPNKAFVYYCCAIAVQRCVSWGRNASIGVLAPQGLQPVEIVFFHYHSREEAYEKWTRRCERINYNNLAVKMTMQNRCTMEHLAAFTGWSTRRNSYLSTALCRRYNPASCFFGYENETEVKDDTTWFRRYIDITRWLNGGKP